MLLIALLAHGLISTALIGALTHQLASISMPALATSGFVTRYRGVNSQIFTHAICLLYVLSVVAGAWIYPDYRLETRIALEEMQIEWLIGLFEIKEHWGALGLLLLPLYRHQWLHYTDTERPSPTLVTATLTTIVWFNFIAGHIVNNARGL